MWWNNIHLSTFFLPATILFCSNNECVVVGVSVGNVSATTWRWHHYSTDIMTWWTVPCVSELEWSSHRSQGEGESPETKSHDPWLLLLIHLQSAQQGTLFNCNCSFAVQYANKCIRLQYTVYKAPFNTDTPWSASLAPASDSSLPVLLQQLGPHQDQWHHQGSWAHLAAD